MDKNDADGFFSKNLWSLQLQLKTLLDGAGGREACLFLDRLSDLSDTEQRLALKVFQRTLDKFENSGERILTDKDRELQEFEENLYRDLVDGVNALKHEGTPSGFSVVDGGKLPPKKKDEKTVCIKAARERLRDSRSEEIKTD